MEIPSSRVLIEESNDRLICRENIKELYIDMQNCFVNTDLSDCEVFFSNEEGFLSEDMVQNKLQSFEVKVHDDWESDDYKSQEVSTIDELFEEDVDDGDEEQDNWDNWDNWDHSADSQGDMDYDEESDYLDDFDDEEKV